MHPYRRNSVAIIALAAAFILTGCESKETPQSPRTPDERNAKITAQLVAADKVDGTEDKVIHKCAGCSLGMDGSDEYSLTTHGYTMHFCKAGCKTGFEKDTDEKILAMKIPE